MVDLCTRDEIIAALERAHDNGVAYWRTLDTRTFLAPIGEAWSPADNVRHLTRSIRAVTKGVALPRLALRILFGRARAPSRPFAEVVRVYDAGLAAGARAPSDYVPRPQEGTEDEESRRRRIMRYHAQAVEGLVAAVGRRRDEQLDRYRLPHPLLGKLTLREMLFFTIHHNTHHVRVVQRRLAAGNPARS